MDSAHNIVVLLKRFRAKFNYMWNIKGINRGLICLDYFGPQKAFYCKTHFLWKFIQRCGEIKM